MHDPHELSPPADTSVPIGRVVSVSGSQAVVMLEAGSPEHRDTAARAEMGTILKIETPRSALLGLISALSVPVPAQTDGQSEIRVAELEMVGELMKTPNGLERFRRGVSTYPYLGDPVYLTSGDELRKAYMWSSDQAVRIGTLRQDPSISALVQVDDLLGKHCAILGSTGTGKSCAVALILRSILEKNRNAHVLLLDLHNEYATCFGDMAEVITPNDLQLPFWFLNFEELVEVIIGDVAGHEAEIEILSEVIPLAKQRFAANRGRDGQIALKKGLGPSEALSYTVDTPVPYRISDLIGLIDQRLGRLENRRDLMPYRQLKTRLETVSQDARYGFMFGALTVQDHMAQTLSRLFRVPVGGRPIAILELTGVPSEIVNVVVSVICRMTFDFCLWGDGHVPVTLVCEEAHRYVPNDARLGFEPTRRAIARIAKEGRKYGVSLCVVSQRPAELDPTILSQCNTIFTMRLSNERDQDIVRAAIFDTAASLLDFLPSMGPREAIVFGDGVMLPARVRFDDLALEHQPRSHAARFSEKWRTGTHGADYMDAVISRWRAAETPVPMEGQAIAGEPDGPGEVEMGVHVNLDTLEPVIDHRPAGSRIVERGPVQNGHRTA